MIITVGTVVKLKVPCMGSPIGTFGVGFNDYGDGCQIIFVNGDYDGFNLEEQKSFLEYVREEPSVAEYQFKNVMQVSHDFHKDIFSKGLV